MSGNILLFNVNYLIKDNCMPICRSLLKYGYYNFSIEILEYCEPSKCIEREKHYFKLFKPEYNISQNPTAPMSGRKHSDETKQKISDALNINQSSISMYFKNNQQKPYKGQYTFQKINVQIIEKLNS
jgi:group I intron endonuclease